MSELDRNIIRAASPALEHSPERGGALLASVSHELRTPLTSLMLGVWLLRRPTALGDGETSEVCELMETAANRLSAMVEVMIDAIHADLATPQLRTVLVSRLLRTASARFELAHPEMQVRLSPGNADAMVRVDSAGLERALESVFANALKYHPLDAPIEVIANADGGSVRISVLDRGPGVAEDELEAIFTPFYRSPGAPYSPGLGLGLAVARRLLMLYGGTICAERRPEGGLSVTMTLPQTEI